jgi:spore coat polysaccharide biosynthesis protein SpsF
MPHVIGVIQGRMGSSRLPGKLLAPIAGRPLVEVLVERVRHARVAEWWLATTDGAEDDVAAAWGESLGLRVLRGDRHDVLSRFAAIVESRKPEWIVRLTADNPFVDSAVVDALVAAAGVAPEVDYVGEGPERRLPLGYVPELVRATAVGAAARDDLPAHHRAHVTSVMRQGGRAKPLSIPEAWPVRPAWRWTVDTLDDLAMADAAFRAFGGGWQAIDYPAMVRILDERPEITGRNASVVQKGVGEG